MARADLVPNQCLRLPWPISDAVAAFYTEHPLFTVKPLTGVKNSPLLFDRYKTSWPPLTTKR